ncbi:unnamed protein product [Oncorhynchus mykiss]|uniref:Gypsy retrotransposon integrase-like protein 1 n=1 Tax=Oncorhynchus mykiss TaxID=8022 RepID=A0A060Z7R9_ONCMY|nr:unnamed protein product [Oncorhynchus mykiss]
MHFPGPQLKRPLSEEESCLEGEVQPTCISGQTAADCRGATIGWPGQEELPQLLKPYWVHQHDFHCNGDLLMKGQWIVIPETLQPEMLDRVHDGHMGITKCRLRPQQWLGLSTQIAKLVAKCDVCTKCQPGHREPMMATELPKRPWQKVGADMFY